MVLVGFLLDRAVGDPVRPTHPARLLGRLIQRYEAVVLPRVAGRPVRERLAGVGLALGLPVSTLFVARSFLRLLPGGVRFAAEAWLVGTCLAGKDLGDAARRVNSALDEGIERGRGEVAMIVGRDTDQMTPEEVVRATVETVAENTSDGVVAPLLYAFAGGAPLSLAYKAVSTLDSMVGYRDERYLRFGWASARLDDLANLLPARLTALLATLVGGGGRRSVRAWWRDRIHHQSPNAGLVEASFAHGLGVRLGGTATYRGVTVRRPQLGRCHRPPGSADVERAVRMSEQLSLVALGLGVGALLAASGSRPREAQV